MSEEGKAIDMMDKMTPEQQAAAQKAFAKKQHVDLTAYKKRIREGNDLKRLQVEELELNNRYFDAKKKWMAVQPELEELEAKEQAVLQKQRADQMEVIKKEKEKAEKSVAAKEETPKIVIPKAEKVPES